MKTTKKLLVISFFCMTLTSLFLIPIAPAQEFVYDGANTERFPYFSVYPSEVFEYNLTGFIWDNIVAANETYYKYEIVKGNNTFYYYVDGFTSQKGYGLWGKTTTVNATSGAVMSVSPEEQLAFWNASIPYNGTMGVSFIPVDDDGIVSPFIFDKVVDYFNVSRSYLYAKAYYDIYSMHFWDAADEYIKLNYTENGILKDYRWVDQDEKSINQTLMSMPTRLPPAFNFTTESGELTVSSKRVTLDLTIPSADNNNDRLPDTDYEYRVLEGEVWSNWTAVTPSIEYNLGSFSPGNITLTVEVKSMYGITQEQIEIEYTPSKDAIPGFSTVLIMVILACSVAILLGRYRKRV